MNIDKPDYYNNLDKIYSKIWNVEDFIENNTFNPEFTHQIEKGIITYLTLFSNSVLAINDYAISNGFNAEQIKEISKYVYRNLIQ